MTPDQIADVALPIVGAAALYRMWRDRLKVELGKPVLPPVGPAGPLDRFWYPLIEPIKVGNAKTEFFETHMRLIAMSGGFKTTLLAYLVRQRIEAGRPVVVLTGGDSDQLETEIRAHGGMVIRPESSPLRFNAFEGSPGFMAQTWAQLFPTSSTAKVYHGAFELAALQYFKSTTSYSVQGLKDFVMAYEPDGDDQGSHQLWKGMKEGYVSIRMARVQEFLGDWIGNELSINDCIRHRMPVMFVIDSKDAPDLNELAAALVWQGMCYGVFQNGTTTGADLFVDEFGRLPTGLISTAVRTFRRNKSHLVAASHTDRDFDDGDQDILADLFHVNVLGRMVASATATRKAASEMTWGTVHPTGFGAHALGRRRSRLDLVTRQPRKGYFWLVDQERVQEVKVFTYKPPKGYVAPFTPLKFAAFTNPEKFSGKSGGTGDGTAVTWKSGHIREFLPAAAMVSATPEPRTLQAPEDRPRTPTAAELRDETSQKSDDVDQMGIRRGQSGTPNRRHGPPECPPIFLPPFATERELDIWVKHHEFPEGMDGDWILTYYCNPGTGRPEMEWRGSPAAPLRKKCSASCTRDHEHCLQAENRWMAYAVVLVLWDLYRSHRPLASPEAAAYITWVRANTAKMKRTVGHSSECQSVRCGRGGPGGHIDWQTNRDNVIQQWDEWRAQHNHPIVKVKEKVS